MTQYCLNCWTRFVYSAIFACIFHAYSQNVNLEKLCVYYAIQQSIHRIRTYVHMCTILHIKCVVY